MEAIENTEAPSFLSRLAGIVVDPLPTLASFRAHPAWLGVLLLTALIQAGAGVLLGPIQGKEVAEHMATSKWLEKLPGEKRDEMLEQMRHPTPARQAIGAVGGVVGLGVMCALIAGVLWLGQRVAGGDGSYKCVLSTTAHAAFVAVGLGMLVIVPLALSRGSVFEVSLSPAAFIDAPITSASYRLLSLLGVFPLWGTALAGLGLGLVSRVSKGVGLAISFATYAVFGAIGFVLSGLAMG